MRAVHGGVMFEAVAADVAQQRLQLRHLDHGAAAESGQRIVGEDALANVDAEAARGVVGGDARSLAIAAASVVAKTTRDRIMERLDRRYPEYGFARHKGYGTAAHRAAVVEHGLSPAHRRCFCAGILAAGAALQTELPFTTR